MAKLLKILSVCFIGFAGYMMMSHDLRGAMLPDERGALWMLMTLFDAAVLVGFLCLSWRFIDRKYKSLGD